MVVSRRASGPLFSILLFVLPCVVAAQDFNFNILPLAINSAFTGMFDGRIRANGIYKRLWSSSKASFNAYGISADAVFARKPGGYFAAGAGVIDGHTDNNTLTNFSSIASVAYHKVTNRKRKHKGEIAVGLQGGYISRNINIADIKNSLAPYIYQLGTGAQYFIVNAGLSFSQHLLPKLSYTFGVSGNNLNLLNDGTVPAENPLLKITPTYTGLLTANWTMSDRFALRPAVLYIINQGFYVTGGEFRYHPGDQQSLNTAFVAVWYRSANVITINPGYEFGHFRVGSGIEYNLSRRDILNDGGFQLNARYIIPRRSTSPAKL